MTLTIRHPLTAGLGIGIAACAGWLAACTTRLPQHPTPEQLAPVDELAARRRRQAMSLHPAYTSPTLDNVIPLHTPNPAS